MSTETNQDESSQPPFQFGDFVRHQSGDVIKVEACKRVVAHSHLRWAVYDANGNRFWARNCGLVERPMTSGENENAVWVDGEIIPCRGCGQTLRIKNRWIADGCPCNSARGINHGFVPVTTCTCKECDPAQTGSARAAAYPNPIMAGESQGDNQMLINSAKASAEVERLKATTAVFVKADPQEHQEDLELEPGTINDQGEFVGISSIDGTKVYAASPAELRAEIETLAKQRDEAREELKESTAEFVRALSLSNREAVLDRAELVGAKVALKQAKEFADGWREVVAKCERLLQMNGPTPTDPATSAVPLQLEHRLKSLTLLEKRIDDAARILDGGKISVSVNQ